MQKDDILCCAAVYPRFLKDKIFDPDTLLQLSKRKHEVRSLSFASYWLCRNEAGVHDFGRMVATEGNRRHSKMSISSATEWDYYLGFYNLRYGSVGRISSSRLKIRVYWKPENGDARHFQLDATPNFRVFCGEVDREIENHKEDLRLAGKQEPKNPPNRDKRIKKLIDAEVRKVRSELCKALFGPILDPMGAFDSRQQLMPKLSES